MPRRKPTGESAGELPARHRCSPPHGAAHYRV